LPTVRERTLALVAMQTFEGSFPLTPALVAILGTSLASLEARLRAVLPTVAGLNEERMKRLWATLIAVKMFEGELEREKDIWELVVEKARSWMAELGGMGIEGVEMCEGLAGQVLHEVKA
jgi:hypothetical protein